MRQFTMFHAFLFAVLIMVASLSGVLFLYKKISHIIERNLSLLVSLSAGVFLVVSLKLVRETIEHASDTSVALFWIGAGAIVIWVLFKILPAFHHHHNDEQEEHTHSYLDARRIMLSDAIHNIGDGILLAVSFSISTPLGIVTALSIFIHEFVQEVSEFFVLRQAGFSNKKALLLNFLVSGTILIGLFGGFFLFKSFEVFEVPLLGIAAGSFLVVVGHDLIPHSVHNSRIKKNYWKHFLWFTLGFLIMLGITLLVGH